MDTETYSSSSEEETFTLGMTFAERLNPGDLVAFYGDLGAGKTEFIKGICEGMNVDELVTSPTYTVVNQYVGENRRYRNLAIYHVDLYRITDPGELLEIGLSDIIADPDAVKLIEWAEIADTILPTVRWDVSLSTLADENSRQIEIMHHDASAVQPNQAVVR